MYSEENYLWGLVGWYLGVLLVLPPLWRITRPLPGFPLRALVRVAVITLLATPMLAYPDMHYLAPAWGVMLFDALSPNRSDSLLRGVAPLAAVFGVLYVTTLLLWLPFRRRTPKASKAAPPPAAPRQPRREPVFTSGPAPEKGGPRGAGNRPPGRPRGPVGSNKSFP